MECYVLCTIAGAILFFWKERPFAAHDCTHGRFSKNPGGSAWPPPILFYVLIVCYKALIKFIKTKQTLHPKGYVSSRVDDNGDDNFGQVELSQCFEKPHHFGAHNRKHLNKFTYSLYLLRNAGAGAQGPALSCPPEPCLGEYTALSSALWTGSWVWSKTVWLPICYLLFLIV